MTHTADEPYPPHDGWFVQRMQDGTWVPFAPTHSRDKALERITSSRLAYPHLKHRLIRETTSYTIDEEN